MAIKVVIQAPGLNLQANVKDEALDKLIQITREFRDQDGILASAGTQPDVSKASRVSVGGNEEVTKAELASFGAAEVLNRFRWDSYPEKILLLAAWREAKGQSIPWKSSDMETAFKQAKEQPPANFPRDIKRAIKTGWIQTHTPRTYSVTRSGWNRISGALTKPE